MPYVPNETVPFERVKRLIKGYGITGSGLAAILGVTKPTGKRKLDNPERLTLADIHAISSKAHIPMNEIWEAIVR